MITFCNIRAENICKGVITRIKLIAKKYFTTSSHDMSKN